MTLTVGGNVVASAFKELVIKRKKTAMKKLSCGRSKFIYYNVFLFFNFE